MPCTAPSRMPRSPKMSDLYSDSSVVWKVYGEPSATDQPSAMSVARPSTSCSHREAGVDAGAVDLFALHVEAAHATGPCPWGRRR